MRLHAEERWKLSKRTRELAFVSLSLCFHGRGQVSVGWFCKTWGFIQWHRKPLYMILFANAKSCLYSISMYIQWSTSISWFPSEELFKDPSKLHFRPDNHDTAKSLYSWNCKKFKLNTQMVAHTSTRCSVSAWRKEEVDLRGSILKVKKTVRKVALKFWISWFGVSMHQHVMSQLLFPSSFKKTSIMLCESMRCICMEIICKLRAVHCFSVRWKSSQSFSEA